MMSIKPTLILLCGLPASGKSTYAEYFKSNNTIILSSDKLRGELYGNINDVEHNEQVFKELYKRAKKYLLADKNVIIDATNITVKSRRKALSHFKDIDCFTQCKVFAIPYKECLARNKQRNKEVPNEAIKRMYSNFQVPFYEEGFDRIDIIREADYFTFQDMLSSHKFQKFNQKTLHHKYDLFTHSKLVFSELSKNDIVNTKNIRYIFQTCMLHDYGKLDTQEFKEGDENAHYYNHANVGCYNIMCDLRPEVNYIDDLNMLFVINYHMLPFDWNTEKTQSKWKNIFGEEKFNLLVEFNKADKIASGTEV